jgi:hypothetical protein
MRDHISPGSDPGPARSVQGRLAVSRCAGGRSIAIGMPASSTAQLSRAAPFAGEIGEPIWRERRCFPVASAYGVPAAFLVVLAVAVGPLAAHLALAAAALATVAALVRARRRALIETYTLSERFVAVEQPGSGRAAVPTDTLTAVTLAGDTVRLHSTLGVLTLGHVARQRALVNALRRVAPDARVERDVTAFCPT